MKRPVAILSALFIGCTVLFCGGCSPAADFEDPKAVVNAYLADYQTGEVTYDITDKFAGKTVCVKTNEKTDPVSVVYSSVSISTGIYVLVDTSDGRIFNYSEGDTIVFEITQVWGRTSSDGKFGDYFINVKVPA